jgi:uncharacterized membrane protein
MEIGVLLGALGLGIVAGLRTLTAPAAVFLARGGWPAIVLGIAALGEFVGDLLPATPARTSPGPFAARIVSGGLVGWLFCAQHGVGFVPGVAAGAIGAVAGTYGGLRGRLAAISAVGPVPAALIEDAIAIGLAAWIVTR